tara:strand:+ start:123 stop:539 length:417 start_codon:yes stop_codon:yes gene_type:complete
MIKIQEENFNVEDEIQSIKSLNSKIGAVTSFIGYVRDINNDKNVNSIYLEVYEEMALNELQKIVFKAKEKWSLIDCLIIHRFGNLKVDEKIVLVASFSKHRIDSFESCNYIMNYLKKDAPFWKKENYNKESKWLENSN